MSKLFFLMVISFTLTATSCNKNPYKDYQGNWEGNYEGEDTGIWKANIDANGKVTGSALSDSI